MLNTERFLFRAWNSGKMIYFGEGFIGFMAVDEETMDII
jgi:hypothetical protein